MLIYLCTLKQSKNKKTVTMKKNVKVRMETEDGLSSKATYKDNNNKMKMIKSSVLNKLKMITRVELKHSF